MGVAFVLLAQFAAALNGIACVVAAREGRTTVAALYLLITIALSLAGVLAWYSASRSKPYRWRDGE
jgi:uncharacterized membrane protein YidH (DUF202 family)